MEPLPAPARVPPGPPRPPAPPTTDDLPRPGWWRQPAGGRRASLLQVLRRCWRQLTLVNWPTQGAAAQNSLLVLAALVVAALFVLVANGVLGSGVDWLTGG